LLQIYLSIDRIPDNQIEKIAANLFKSKSKVEEIVDEMAIFDKIKEIPFGPLNALSENKQK
jgi:hypothetical protein